MLSGLLRQAHVKERERRVLLARRADDGDQMVRSIACARLPVDTATDWPCRCYPCRRWFALTVCVCWPCFCFALLCFAADLGASPAWPTRVLRAGAGFFHNLQKQGSLCTRIRGRRSDEEDGYHLSLI
jgi:hypothetical protein